MKILRGCGIALVVCVALVAALFSLEGCGGGERAELDTKQVAGVWTGSGGGRVEFRSNGRFAMSGIPRSAVVFGFSTPPPGDSPLSGQGTWELEGSSGRGNSIQLRFQAGGSFPDDSESGLLRVEKADDHPTLYFDSDSDKAYGYEIQRAG